ncbi:MAG: pyridoxamine 5'-phosphate oxidase family protein [Chloroflexota bacterium]|nr:pyridoxamine 5'-phosphate oxidase family protein [Chloroflexota bacterium]
MIYLDDRMRELLYSAMDDRCTCLLGTADGEGKPQISMKGSVMVFDRETLAYWERAKRSALENVAANPNVVIFYRNSPLRITWRFHGKAVVYESGAIRDNVMYRTVQAELDRDPERQGAAVLVKIDSITDLAGNVLQGRDGE